MSDALAGDRKTANLFLQCRSIIGDSRRGGAFSWEFLLSEEEEEHPMVWVWEKKGQGHQAALGASTPPCHSSISLLPWPLASHFINHTAMKLYCNTYGTILWDYIYSWIRPFCLSADGFRHYLRACCWKPNTKFLSCVYWINFSTNSEIPRPDSIERFIDGQAFFQSYDGLLVHPLTPSPGSNLSLFLIFPVCRRSSVLTEKGRGSKSYDREKAWPSSHHSKLSGQGKIHLWERREL